MSGMHLMGWSAMSAVLKAFDIRRAGGLKSKTSQSTVRTEDSCQESFSVLNFSEFWPTDRVMWFLRLLRNNNGINCENVCCSKKLHPMGKSCAKLCRKFAPDQPYTCEKVLIKCLENFPSCETTVAKVAKKTCSL